MKLNLVVPRTGASWVKLGMRTFLRQPLALSGVFLLFMALMTLLSQVPVIGFVLAMVALPSATLGLMVATKEANEGRFPMPLVLLSALRAGRQQTLSMLLLGGLYALGFLAAIGLSTLADGGDFARIYLGGATPTREMMMEPGFQLAMWVFIGVHLPLSLMFWHAPALVHWHAVSPVKSLFFSLLACLRNFWAYTVFALSWLLVLVLLVTVATLVSALLALPGMTGEILLPALLLLASMFFTSLYFTFRDTFDATSASPT